MSLVQTKTMIKACPLAPPLIRFQAWLGPQKHVNATTLARRSYSGRPMDDHDGYVLEITRCLSHPILVRCHALGLMPILCEAETNWADAIDPRRHRMRFVRPSTFATPSAFATAEDRCRMWFMRTDGDAATSAEDEHGA